jgi:hypothetical protein
MVPMASSVLVVMLVYIQTLPRSGAEVASEAVPVVLWVSIISLPRTAVSDIMPVSTSLKIIPLPRTAASEILPVHICVSLMDIRFLIFFCYASEANNNTPFGIMVHSW